MRGAVADVDGRAPDASDAVVCAAYAAAGDDGLLGHGPPEHAGRLPPAACAASIAARAAAHPGPGVEGRGVLGGPRASAVVCSAVSARRRRPCPRRRPAGQLARGGSRRARSRPAGRELRWSRCGTACPLTTRADQELHLGDVLRLVDDVAGEAGVLPRAGEHAISSSSAPPRATAADRARPVAEHVVRAPSGRSHQATPVRTPRTSIGAAPWLRKPHCLGSPLPHG